MKCTSSSLIQKIGVYLKYTWIIFEQGSNYFFTSTLPIALYLEVYFHYIWGIHEVYWEGIKGSCTTDLKIKYFILFCIEWFVHLTFKQKKLLKSNRNALFYSEKNSLIFQQKNGAEQSYFAFTKMLNLTKNKKLVKKP